MKTTIIILLDPRRPKNDGTFPISLRFVHKRIPIYINTGYSVLKEHWDDNLNEITKDCKKYSRLVRTNNEIKQKQIDASLIIEDLNNTGEIEKLTPSELKAKILNKSVRMSFREFNNKIIEELKLSKKLGNASCYEQAQAFLDKYTKARELYFEDIDFKLLKTLEAKHLSNNYTYNSLSFYLRTIRATFNRAIKEGVIKRDVYPFTNYSIKETKTLKRAISKTDIEKIRDVELVPNSTLWHARNMFMFSFYNIGINFVDMSYLKKSNLINNRICYTRAKTGKNYSIKITASTHEILNMYLQGKGDDDYIFPIIQRQELELQRKDLQNGLKNFNKYMKQIAKKLEINATLTSYVARHSWATIAKGLNVPISVISEGLGHEDIKTTQIYLDSFDANVIDDANALITG
ncbi:MAG: site-specific integrase [Bacteroidales bacterium]|nr:site-specific integrase [Bacteroidales bacterium]